MLVDWKAPRGPLGSAGCLANVITVSVPDGITGQVWWSVNLGDNTKARIYNGTQLAFRRNIGIPEYSNQPPQTLQGYRELPTTGRSSQTDGAPNDPLETRSG